MYKLILIVKKLISYIFTKKNYKMIYSSKF